MIKEIFLLYSDNYTNDLNMYKIFNKYKDVYKFVKEHNIHCYKLFEKIEEK